MANGTQAAILVVEPDHETRVEIRRALESKGYFVLSAGHGAEALVLLQNVSVPRLVLLSVQTPMMSGEHFLTLFRAHEQFENVPVLQILGVGDAALSQASQSVMRPIDERKLLEAVESCLKEIG